VSRFERRRSIATEPVIAGARPTMLEGDEPFEVSCDPAQQDALWKATSARRGTPVVLEVRATLVPEGGDGPATIGVRLEGIRVGTLDPDDAADLSEGLLAVMHRNNTDVAVRARVVGGATARAGDRRQLDVWVYLDPIDFGFDPPALEAIRTGHSVSADPRWAAILPRESSERVRFLRNQLKTEDAPVQRHLMFNALEDVLYRTRDSGPSALGEYEQVVMAHDAEMAMIVPALFAEFGGIPELPAYGHLARILARRHRVTEAFHWATRGLELYGDQGMNVEVVNDLRARADAYGRLVGQTLVRPADEQPTTPARPTPEPLPVPMPVESSAAPAAWYPDPTGRTELRFWDGARWTQHVSTNGTTGVDRLR
jgi:hypothetical protein